MSVCVLLLSVWFAEATATHTYLVLLNETLEGNELISLLQKCAV